MKWSDGITEPMDMNLSKLQEIVKDREAWRAAVHEAAQSQTRVTLSNCTMGSYISQMPELHSLGAPRLLKSEHLSINSSTFFSSSFPRSVNDP